MFISDFAAETQSRGEKTKSVEEVNDLTGKILDCCIIVHKEMGPGLL